ncbi:SEC23-interacting protein-like [Engraulis encrasicolus]|uniref:SEC23-interacting protein-like n=1 Tax=Engraulis encrasicolus TaxID=184585 RepID=UPI002FCFEC86
MDEDGAAVGRPYEAVRPHWFHRKHVDGQDQWVPFSQYDSDKLNAAFDELTEDQEMVVATDNGHYDVRLGERSRRAAYWPEEPSAVLRATWFYKSTKEPQYTPYPESFSERLELTYMEAMLQDQWRKTVNFPTGEVVVLISPTQATQWPSGMAVDEWASSDMLTSTYTVERGIDKTDYKIPQGELETVDHLVFMVHGIGPACDFRFRNLISCVNGFRNVAKDLVETHCRSARATGQIGRVEFLPVDWHSPLHGDATGVDKVIHRITLPSIERLRTFANETLLDLFFYGSPTYCQTILDTVASELNRLHGLFCSRHPHFQGQVSLVGHSLGSLILFDLLTNQVVGLGHPNIPETQDGRPVGPIMAPNPQSSGLNATENTGTPSRSTTASSSSVTSSEAIHSSHRMRLMSSSVDNESFSLGVGQVSIRYPQLSFNPYMLFALGSPIGMFLTVRGLRHIDPDYSLPTCKGFYNIYHPLDPVAYRIEPLIQANTCLPPVLVPHITTKRAQQMGGLSSDLKHKMTSALLYAWQFFNHTPSSSGQSQRDASPPKHKTASCSSLLQSGKTNRSSPGMLNRGRRIDYVLQQTAMESINEYLFAIQSHLCYWESEDTALLLLQEIYNESGIVFENLP